MTHVNLLIRTPIIGSKPIMLANDLTIEESGDFWVLWSQVVDRQKARQCRLCKVDICNPNRYTVILHLVCLHAFEQSAWVYAIVSSGGHSDVGKWVDGIIERLFLKLILLGFGQILGGTDAGYARRSRRKWSLEIGSNWR
jgi:hypothetical protein